ncbi:MULTISPECIES: copper amine oxidase N-terminal domain-containing protein [unclassified Paenibacillus]|uniref:copper amine oxidase N-terminal domain-containing protein n=1 Tax=unclassified Paenibacillus TaxID=185978 RepID=UPI0030F97938
MKKIIALLMTVLLLCSVFPASTYAAQSVRVVVDGSKISFPDAQPFLDKQNRVQVPVRFVSEALGAKVGWTPASKTVTVELNGKKLVLVIGNRQFTLDGAKKTMDTAALMKNGRTFVPLKFVSAGLGVGVNWDQSVSTAYISTDGKTPVISSAPAKGTAKTSNGFTYYTDTGSMLQVNSSTENPPKGKAVLVILVDFEIEGADYAMQMKEAEAIMRQKIEPATVDAMLAYVAPKKTVEYNLPFRTFEDEKYKINVSSTEYNALVFTIYRK